MNVTIARYALGLAAAVVTFGSLAGATAALRCRYLPDWRGAPARLAEAAIGLLLLTAVLELLGAAGLFGLGPIVVACAVLTLGILRVVGRPHAGRASVRLPITPATLAATAAGIAVTAEWAIPTLQSYDFGIRSFDSLWYHLPWAAAFAQSGQIAPLHFTDVEYLTAFYPATAELFHGLGIVFFARDTLSPTLNLVWLWLVLLAAYCVGRPRGVGAATFTGAALAMAVPMMRFSQPGSAANDVVGVFLLLASVALLLNARENRVAWGLAGACAGLAIGVKLSMVVAALALTVGAIVIAPRGRRRASALLWAGPFVLAGGFWYLRNLIAVGNPLPWLHVPGFQHPEPPLQQHTGYAVAHYLFDGHVLSKVFEPGLAAGLGPWWWAVVAAALIGPLLCVAPGAGAMARMLSLVALAAVVGYVLTPESAAGPAGMPLVFAFNLRYAAPALALCLVVTPLAPVFAGARRQLALLAGFMILLIATLAAPHLWPSAYLLGGLLLAAAALAGAAALSWRPLPAAALMALLAVIGGYLVQRHYLRVRYAYQPGVSSLGRLWAYFRRVHHARVGVVGTFGGFFSYPLVGLDISNTVQYIADRGPHGSFTPIGSCTAWRAAVNAARLRYLATTPARDPWHPAALFASPEYGWTATDRAARIAYRYHALGQPISVFELRGRLDPSSCATR